MAGSSISQLIVFTASMLIVASAATTLTGQISQIGAVIDDQAVELNSQIRTEINLISDTKTDLYNESSNNFTLLVHNTGSAQLPTDSDNLDILVDGQFGTTVTIEPIDSQTWDPGVIARITVEIDLSAGSHQVTVRINDVEETLRFTV